MNWYDKPYKDALDFFGSDKKNGLKDEVAKSKQAEYGLNKLEEKKKTSLIIRFFMQFNNFMIIILLIAAATSFGVSWINGDKDFIDPIIILIIVILNAILGLVQEQKAEKSIEALQKMSSPMSKVLRDGKHLSISTEQLVPGDIIVLETGDMVPADARLITAINLKAEEAALTGESVPVEKDASLIAKENATIGDRHNMVFSGSSISYGRGTAVVTETGMHTQVGKIAHMIMKDDAPDTPLQKRLEHMGKILGIGALSICFVIFLMGILRQIPPFEMFMTSISLAVAAIPEGLPAIVTIMLAIGVQRMAKQNAIIRKLPAVETLGSANIICSDKTGTLTQNKMTVVEVWCGNDIPQSAIPTVKRDALKLSAMCNDTVLQISEGKPSFTGDPTEIALVMEAYKMGSDKNKLDEEFPRVEEVPFDSKRKLMSTIHKAPDGGYIVITKGAPDILLSRCSQYIVKGRYFKMDSNKKRDITHENTLMAEKALRVLGVSYKTINTLPKKIDDETVENDLIFVGLIGMIDPPRDEAKISVQTCKKAGIKPVMVTGDHIITAKAIAKKLSIMENGDNAISGDELNNTSDEELSKNIYNYSVFARVSPEHKVRIVKAFQSRGAVVAMTGDGVNDAPALKAADIGCAMGISGTDVAKSAADMILTDDNFATIVEAVKEGRGIYSNIRKSCHFLLSSNIGEIITILIAIFLGWATPLLAIHLLWINLVTDSLPAIALGLEPADDDIMNKTVSGNNSVLFSPQMWQRIILEGIMIGMLSIIAFGIGTVYFDSSDSVQIGRTMAFATLSISQLVHAFNMRSENSIFKLNFFENKQLIWAFIIGFLLQFSVISIPLFASIFKVTPLNLQEWSIVLVLSIMPLVIVELQKYFSFNTLNLTKTKMSKA